MSHIRFSYTEFLSRIRAMIQKEHLLSKGDSVLVGLSGGADSVALLRVLLELRGEYSLKLSCAHINHGIREKTAERDMEFCRKLCEKFALPISVLEVDVQKIAKEEHLCVEDAGRQVRYAFFREQNTDKIAVAHTKDDNAETVLMNLVRGSCPIGIAPCRENIIRPLLAVTKAEIYTYLESLGQNFVTDETNFTADYTRNRMRLEFIPAIEKNFNINFTNTVYHSADVLYQEQKFLEKLTDELYRKVAKEQNGAVMLDVKSLLAEDEVLIKRAIRRAYYHICRSGESISYEQLERVSKLCKDGKKGKQISLPGNIIALYSGDFLVITHTVKNVAEPILLELDNSVSCWESENCVCLSKTENPKGLFCYPIRVREGETVTLRTRCDGDKLYFGNLNIHKRLSDFLIDKKIPLHERDQIPLICVDDAVRVVVGHFYEEVNDCPTEEKYYIIIT